MVRRFTRWQVRALALVAVVVWAWTGLAAQLHDLLVIHTVCPEHHEVVESHRSASASFGADPSQDRAQRVVADSAAAHHDHGCAVHGLVRLGLPQAVVLIRPSLRVRTVEDLRVAGLSVPASPLDYAPKTSPPTIG